MNITLEVAKITGPNNRVYFSGESAEITFKTNNPELSGEPIEFIGESYADVVKAVINRLKSTGVSGRLLVKKLF